jgi:nitroreductase
MTNPTLDLLLTRRSVLAKNLGEPGPDEESLHKILSAGIRVPDHGRAEPWRIQVLRKDAQRALAETCVEIFRRETPSAADAQIEVERQRTQRSPVLLVVTSHPDSQKFSKIPEIEQTLSSAAVCQNILIATRALGFDAQWVTDWPAYHPEIRVALGHQADTRIVGFIHVGTAIERPNERQRPEFDAIVSEWSPTSSS